MLPALGPSSGSDGRPVLPGADQELLLMVVPRPTSAEQVSSRFARGVHEAATEAARLQRGVELAVALVRGCSHAGITVLTPSFVETVAASDDTGRLGDCWQHELSEGPALDSLRGRVTVVSQDLGVDTRWRSWGPRAVFGLGLRSTMSVLLDLRADTVGSLNLYADRAGVFDPERQALCVALAGRLTFAVADARTLDQRTRSLLARTGVGQAQGIVMERFGLDADQALDYLCRLAERSRTPLVHLAERVVDTRDLPDPRDPTPGPGRGLHPKGG